MTDKANTAPQPFSAPDVTPDIEAPFIWAIKIPSLQSMILTVRANSAADLAERIDALSIELPKITADTMAMIDHVVSEIRARAPETPRPAGQPSPRPPVEHPSTPPAPAPQTGKKQPSGQKPKKQPGSGSSDASTDDDGEQKTEGTMTAVRIEVLHNPKNHKNYLAIWDRKRAADKYAPMTSYMKPAALASLFTSGNWTSSDFESEGVILETSDDPVEVEWKSKTANGKTYYNPTKIHM